MFFFINTFKVIIATSAFTTHWTIPVVPRSCPLTSGNLLSQARFEFPLCHQLALFLHIVFWWFQYLSVIYETGVDTDTRVCNQGWCWVWRDLSVICFSKFIREYLRIMINLALLCNMVLILSSGGIPWFKKRPLVDTCWCLLWTRHIIPINSPEPHNDSVIYVWLPRFIDAKIRGSERLTNAPDVTQWIMEEMISTLTSLHSSSKSTVLGGQIGKGQI